LVLPTLLQENRHGSAEWRKTSRRLQRHRCDRWDPTYAVLSDTLQDDVRSRCLGDAFMRVRASDDELVATVRPTWATS